MKKISILASLALAVTTPVSAAVSFGGIVVIGYQDNNTTNDWFAIAATEQITAGEVIYFTDNGWNSTTNQFRGASATDGDGNENLIRLTVNSNLAAGTIVSMLDTTNPLFTWEYSNTTPASDIPGVTVSSDNRFNAGTWFSTTGDQIYAFQGNNASNPMLNVTNHIYALDFSNGVFENVTGTNDGDVPTGLSTSAFTAFALTTSGTPTFHSGTFGLNFSDPDIALLLTNGGTNSEWLQAIANTSNWGTGITTNTPLNIGAVPEPSRWVLSMIGFAGLLLRRRRA